MKRQISGSFLKRYSYAVTRKMTTTCGLTYAKYTILARKSLAILDGKNDSLPWTRTQLANRIVELEKIVEAANLLAMRVERLAREVKMMVDGYNPDHPLGQKCWEAGVIFTVNKDIELVFEAIAKIREFN